MTVKACVCVGDYAAVPYCFEGLNVRVYCMEELCCALRENAFLLDADIMSDKLLKFIEQECGLKDLAAELYPLVHEKGSLSGFVTMIMEYVAFYDTGVISQVEQTLKSGAGRGVLEKRKGRIDYLVERRKYGAAIREYDSLMDSWEEAGARGETPGAPLRAGLLHNRGVALAGLMRYEEAADSFREAWQTDGNKDSLSAFLAARRLSLEESEYIAFVAGLPECYEISLELEQKMERLNQEWEKEPDRQLVKDRVLLRCEGEETEYEEEMEKVLQAMKSSYRNMVT